MGTKRPPRCSLNLDITVWKSCRRRSRHPRHPHVQGGWLPCARVHARHASPASALPLPCQVRGQGTIHRGKAPSRQTLFPLPCMVRPPVRHSPPPLWSHSEISLACVPVERNISRGDRGEQKKRRKDGANQHALGPVPRPDKCPLIRSESRCWVHTSDEARVERRGVQGHVKQSEKALVSLV